MVICLEQGADLHMAQLMQLPLTVSCFSKLQIGFTFLVPAHPGSPGKRDCRPLHFMLLSTPSESISFILSPYLFDGSFYTYLQLILQFVCICKCRYCYRYGFCITLIDHEAELLISGHLPGKPGSDGPRSTM